MHRLTQCLQEHLPAAFGLGDTANPPPHRPGAVSYKQLNVTRCHEAPPRTLRTASSPEALCTHSHHPSSKGALHPSSLPPPSTASFFSGTGLQHSRKSKNYTTAFQNFLSFLLLQNCIFILPKNGKISANGQSVSNGAAATLVVIQRSSVGRRGRIMPHAHFPRRDGPTLSGRATTMSVATSRPLVSLVCDSCEAAADKAPAPTAQLCCGEPQTVPGALPELRSTQRHPHRAHYPLTGHTSPPCSATSDGAAGVSQRSTSPTSWRGGCSSTFGLLTRTAVTNSEQPTETSMIW